MFNCFLGLRARKDFIMKSRLTAYLLWFFLGPFSVHNFYLGKIGKGILYLLTGQLFGVGWIIDGFILEDMVDHYNNIKRKKNLTLATILPLLFGPFGLCYTSLAVGIIMILISVFLGVFALLISLNTAIYIFFILHLFIILWSIEVAKRKNIAIDKNENISTDVEINIVSEVFMSLLIVIFFTFLITAIVCQFKEINILSTNKYAFYGLGLFITILVSELSNKTISQKHNKKLSNQILK